MQARFHRGALTLLAGALMSACGGGGDDGPAPMQEVPDTALASPAGFMQFARGLPAGDDSEPLNLQRVDVAPTNEAEEPASLD